MGSSVKQNSLKIKKYTLPGLCIVLYFRWKQRTVAAAAAKSLQSCPTLCGPTDGSLRGSPIPRILEWVAISFSNAWKWKVKVKSLSCVRFLATPWTAAYQAPPSMGFSRQEYRSGVPSPSPKELLEMLNQLVTQGNHPDNDWTRSEI